MERELQLELLEKLIQAHIKSHLFLQMMNTRNEFLVKGLDSLSKCLSQKIKPDVWMKKKDQQAQHKINEYCRRYAKKIVKDYENELRE